MSRPTRQDSKPSFLREWNSWLTFVIAAATIAMTVVTYVQWRTAIEELSLARNTFASTHRPFLGLTNDIVTKARGNKLIDFVFTIRNFGSAPARFDKVRWDVMFRGERSLKASGKQGGQNMLFPQDEIFLGIFLNEEETRDAFTGKAPLAAIFEVYYFGTNQDTLYTYYEFKFDQYTRSFATVISEWR